MLGLFDSGLGGTTVLRRLHEALPEYDVVYFADQANVPYGDRSVPDLLQLLHNNFALLEQMGIEALVMACNTSCAVASEFGWPPAAFPVLDLIESAAIAVERESFERIAVVATLATARSGAYARQILARHSRARVVEVAAPALVPLVESPAHVGIQAEEAVARVCAGFAGTIDAVVLGCTHYPLLREHFESALGPGVVIVDPAEEHAKRTVELVRGTGIPAGRGRCTCLTSGPPAAFRARLEVLLAGIPFEVKGAFACPEPT
jgi:glutamate racemase